MKRLLIVMAVLCLAVMATTSVWAEVTITPINGTVTPLATDSGGLYHGYGVTSWDPDRPREAVPGNLYDNFPPPTGTSSPGGLPTVGGGTIPGGYTFVDWTASAAQWGDDLHGLPAGNVITMLNYGYFNTVATATHIVKFYDMVSPSASHGSVTTSIVKGPFLGSVVVPGVPPTAGGLVSVTGLSIVPLSTSAWIKFEEVGQGAPATFWLTGGMPGVGYSHGPLGAPDAGLNYTVKGVYNLWLPIPYLYFGGGSVYASNIVVALNGVPEPAAIGLLALGGVVALGWRRRR